MNEAGINSIETNSSLNFLKEITDTVNQLANLFDRTIDAISTYGVGVGQKVKKLWIKFLTSMGFIDKELNQISHIKNHLADIQRAIANNDPTVSKNAGTLIWGLQEMSDAFVQRMNGSNSFYNDLWFAVQEIWVTIEDIKNNVRIK